MHATAMTVHETSAIACIAGLLMGEVESATAEHLSHIVMHRSQCVKAVDNLA